MAHTVYDAVDPRVLFDPPAKKYYGATYSSTEVREWRPLSIQGGAICWQGLEGLCRFPKPGKCESKNSYAREATIVPQLLELSVVNEVMKRVLAYDEGFAHTPDSVDGNPAFQLLVISRGLFSKEAEASGLDSIIQTLLRTQILPYIRSRYDLPNAEACTCLVRRYLPNERRTHPAHFDVDALVTVVVGLNPDEFEGGLYILPTPHSSSRTFVNLGKGDIVTHSYDLMHGVEVFAGVRYSLVFWFKDSAAACEYGTAGWYEAAAADGDPDAQMNLAMSYAAGARGLEQDSEKALHFYRLAAEQGHAVAQFLLGNMLEGSDREQAMQWLKASAEQGYASAQRCLAMAMLNGRFDSEDMQTMDALHWLRKAAEQGDKEAAFKFAIVCETRGAHSSADVWRKMASDQGHPAAQLAQAQALLATSADTVHGVVTASADIVRRVGQLLLSAGNGGEEEAERILVSLKARSFPSLIRLQQALCVWAAGVRVAHGSVPTSPALAASDALWSAAARPALLTLADASHLLAQLSKAAAGELHITDWSAAIWAAAILAIPLPKVEICIAHLDPVLLEQLEPEILAKIVCALAYLYLQHDAMHPSSQLLPLLSLTAKHIEDLNAEAFANTLWALAVFRLKHVSVLEDDLLDGVVHAITLKLNGNVSLQDFKSYELAHCAWALVVLGVAEQHVLQTLASALARNLSSQSGDTLGRGDLEAAGWAFATAAGKDDHDSTRRAFDFNFNHCSEGVLLHITRICSLVPSNSLKKGTWLILKP